MTIENSIGWTDATTNAVTGCDKVSPGCKNCYAAVGTRARVLRAQGIETWGPNGFRHPVNFEMVFRRLDRLCVCADCHHAVAFEYLGGKCVHEGCGGVLRRIRLFADSNSDWLDPKWPVETLAKFLDAIRLSPNVDVQLLTKRIDLFFGQLGGVYNYAKATNQTALLEWVGDWMNLRFPKNVWIGVSAEDQKRANERIPKLLQIPAAVYFVSAEPLLERIEFDPYHLGAGGRSGRNYQQPQIDWIIVGGESGEDRRDCGVDAIESVVDQCVRAGVPVYCKQDVAFKSGQRGRIASAVWLTKEFPR